MRHDISETKVNDQRDEADDFLDWLKDKYPGVQVERSALCNRLGWSRIVNGVFLKILITITLGTLTRFHVGTRSHAVWLLVWMYGTPALRWTRLMYITMENEPCLSLLKWSLSAVFFFVNIGVAFGVYGGITVISVELLGAMCETDFSLSPSV